MERDFMYANLMKIFNYLGKVKYPTTTKNKIRKEKKKTHLLN